MHTLRETLHILRDVSDEADITVEYTETVIQYEEVAGSTYYM